MTSTNATILTRLKNICHSECSLQAEFLRHLVTLLEDGSYAELGYSSLFALCTKGLGMSFPSASTRIVVAQLAQRVPLVLEWLARGETNLTSLRILAKVLTVENATQVLKRAKGLSTREVERLVAERSSSSKKQRDVVRPVGGGHPPPANPERPPAPNTPGSPQEKPEEAAERELFPDPVSAPVSYRVSATLSQETMQKLERVRELLSSKIPHGDLEQVLASVLEDYLERHDPLRKRKRTVEAREPVSSKASRYISRAVRRLVWQRDGGQCAFVSPVTGQRCQARHNLEIHHVTPFARGGSSREIGNLRLFCRTHNQWQARADYGAGFIEKKVRPRPDSRREHAMGPRTSLSHIPNASS